MSSIETLRRGVVGVLVQEGRLLVITRSQHVRAPGKSCFPGGGIEPGETAMQAVVRELKEEVDLDVVAKRELWRKITPWKIDLSWWLVECPSPETLRPAPAEVESVSWLCPQEIVRLQNLLPSNHEFLAAWREGIFEIDGLSP